MTEDDTDVIDDLVDRVTERGDVLRDDNPVLVAGGPQDDDVVGASQVDAVRHKGNGVDTGRGQAQREPAGVVLVEQQEQWLLLS